MQQLVLEAKMEEASTHGQTVLVDVMTTVLTAATLESERRPVATTAAEKNIFTGGETTVGDVIESG